MKKLLIFVFVLVLVFGIDPKTEEELEAISL